ncbi:hypothetical protein SR42_15320 [Clostridium botulinum]|uniref:hypothetical protein n=1 Tax=Clostridium botulinum TaxID=1491 RepID=UPI000596E912|nr:hypothetical protein [Clostridium botulinum]KIL06932.1 hypothetical protein SR42_15320 [Clostridium botulinum]MBY6935262.1 hypothetical protein [Clostridium botulinum]NFL82103.1 hypothetical protein [Clostridium botulinum]NFN12692.1 hypothetical protein [Clostridium botulinum]NFO37901.1 hypothetical protein [Clostridium botulinum]
MDIEKLRKEMTREEFLNDRSLTNNEGCPNEYELKEYEPCKGITCKECWRNAVKDIKFKDDIEVKKMSKELNILQAIEMPIGTRFDFDIETNGVSDFIEVMKGNEEPKILCWNGDKHSRVNVCSSTSVIKLTVIQQPVSFMEALESGKKVKVKCEGYLDIDKNYYLISEIFKKIIKGNEVFGENETEKAIKSFIINGQWYIKEDNAND